MIFNIYKLAVTMTMNEQFISHVSSCVISSVSSVSSLLELGRGMDKLFKVFIWGSSVSAL